MANKRTRDLTTEATYDGDAFVQIDKDSYAEARKQKVSVLLSNELSLRQTADNAIIAGAGLSAGGSYTTDDTTNYIKSTDFVAAGLTPSLKNADKLIDAKINELNVDFVVSGLGIRYYAPPAVITSLDWSSKLLYDIPDISSLILLQSLDLNNNSLTTVTIPSTLTALETLDLNNNSLTTVTIPSTLTALTTLNLYDNALNLASVDAVLLNLDTAGALNGTLYLSGGTNASPTGGATNVNKLSLEGKGWTVNIN
jgi:Leucine-rich repeat (LRR) protein